MAGSFKSMVWDYYLPTDMHEASSSYALFGEEFFRFFLNDKRFAKMGSSVSLIVAFVCIFQIERSVYIGAMRGEKEVVIPRRIATL